MLRPGTNLPTTALATLCLVLILAGVPVGEIKKIITDLLAIYAIHESAKGI
jgi:hypothetical protein